MSKQVITNIESKTKATKWFSMSDALFIAGFTIVALMFRKYVSTYMVVPYMIFSFLMGVYLMLPSGINKGRNNMHSIIVFFKKDKYVYRTYINEEKKEEENE